MRDSPVEAKHGHFCLFAHGFSEAGPAARNDRIETFSGPDQFDRHLLVRAFNDDPCAGWNSMLLRGLAQPRSDDLLRPAPLRRATKHTEVTGLEAERNRLH